MNATESYLERREAVANQMRAAIAIHKARGTSPGNLTAALQATENEIARITEDAICAGCGTFIEDDGTAGPTLCEACNLAYEARQN